MNCIKCNSELVAGKQFCPNCGALNNEQEPRVVLQKNVLEKHPISFITLINVIRDKFLLLKQKFLALNEMKRKIIFYLSGIILLTLFGYMVRNNNSTSPEDWSEHLGKTKKWDVARETCYSYGMRLPNIKELQEAYKAGIMNTWECCTYWSSTPYDEERYYIFSNNNGGTAYSDRNSWFFSNNVRCHR